MLTYINTATPSRANARITRPLFLIEPPLRAPASLPGNRYFCVDIALQTQDVNPR
jgi:hypothetical protein